MKCTEIKPGMIFDWPRDRSAVWKVIESGTYYISDGKKKRCDNGRRNKWWCQPVDESMPPSLCCFEEVFDRELWNFRKP